jgi:hypothetical protein
MEKITVEFWTVEEKNGKRWFFEHTRQVYPESILEDVSWHIKNHNKHHGTNWQLYGKPFVAVI